MSFTNIWIHLVWTTKNRHPFLNDGIRLDVFKHIRENAKIKGILLDHINGYSDHVHCLVKLGADQSVSKIAQMLKGESSFWINKNDLTSSKFSWQEEYYVGSVDPSKLGVVRNYIRNQEDHHKKKTFQEEYEELMKEFDLRG